MLMLDFDQHGNLPPGIHPMTWQEFEALFGTNAHRRQLLAGLKVAIDLLRRAGCRTVYVNGSFVTSKALPGDFDGCWDAEGVSPQFLHRLAPEFFGGGAEQKRRFGGELFPAQAVVGLSGKTFLEFFQSDKLTGEPKGIVAIALG